MSSRPPAGLPLSPCTPARHPAAFRALDHHPRRGRLLPYALAVPAPTDQSQSARLVGLLHSDFTSACAGATDTALGVPLTVHFLLVDAQAPDRALLGLRLRLWHGTQDGQHSLLVMGTQNGTASGPLQTPWQTTDAEGRASFITLFPGHYAGQLTQIRFEVHPPDRFPGQPWATATSPPAWVAGHDATRHQAQVSGHPRSGYAVTLHLALAN
jgi:protocatechuate 3,4-dioxygenase beta subunit